MLHLKLRSRVLAPVFVPLALATLLSACNNSSDNDDTPAPPPPVVVTATYQVTVTNLTSAQPFSPVAVVLHSTGELWQIGQPASAALETLAESGDNTALIASDFVVSSATHSEALIPGTSADITISTTDESARSLSLATMLVNTNDAFSGLNVIDLAALEVDASISFTTNVLDAGTEVNSEAAGTIPGPADGGEGFNAARDDVNVVAMHPGVVTSDDGIADSVLSGEHKFDNPAMAVKITRTE